MWDHSNFDNLSSIFSNVRERLIVIYPIFFSVDAGFVLNPRILHRRFKTFVHDTGFVLKLVSYDTGFGTKPMSWTKVLDRSLEGEK